MNTAKRFSQMNRPAATQPLPQKFFNGRIKTVRRYRLHSPEASCDEATLSAQTQALLAEAAAGLHTITRRSFWSKKSKLIAKTAARSLISLGIPFAAAVIAATGAVILGKWEPAAEVGFLANFMLEIMGWFARLFFPCLPVMLWVIMGAQKE